MLKGKVDIHKQIFHQIIFRNGVKMLESTHSYPVEHDFANKITSL